mgnify:FL=1
MHSAIKEWQKQAAVIPDWFDFNSPRTHGSYGTFSLDGHYTIEVLSINDSLCQRVAASTKVSLFRLEALVRNSITIPQLICL